LAQYIAFTVDATVSTGADATFSPAKG